MRIVKWGFPIAAVNWSRKRTDAMTPYQRAVLDQVDGIKTVREISRLLHDGCSNGATFAAMRSLRSMGYVIANPKSAWMQDWVYFRTEKARESISEKQSQRVLFAE